MKFNEICKQLQTMYIVKDMRWSLILRHDYPSMDWKQITSLAGAVSQLHSFEETIDHLRVRNLLINSY